MSEKYDPPSGPPPAYRRTQSGYDQQQQQHSVQPQRVSWTVGGGPSSQTQPGSNNPYRDHLGVPQHLRPSSINLPNTQSRDQEKYQPPPGPPPGHQDRDVEMADEDYQPPPGAPPGPGPQSDHYTPSPATTPKSGGSEQPPPPYDPWTNADETANADYDEAARAHAWCRETPLWPAQEQHAGLIERSQVGDLRITVPPNTTDVTQYQPSLGRSYVRTSSGLGDTIMLSDIPIYAANKESPLYTGQPKTLYYELHVMGIGDRYGTGKNVESGIAIGFAAPPYPAWRLPGWHRGSLGVHGDDGRRYVDNSFGGIEFTSPFKKGDVLGIGMTFNPPVHGDRVSLRCEVFFTRNGKKDGGWDLHEERPADADAGDIHGLEGDFDLLAAVGVFGSVEFECVFRREEWLYKF